MWQRQTQCAAPSPARDAKRRIAQRLRVVDDHEVVVLRRAPSALAQQTPS